MDKSKKILVIDDDPDFVETTRIILESNSYSVSSAPGPDEGLRKVAEEKPDLIILDVMWPDRISGFEVCRRLKKDVNFSKIPVLMITAVDKEYGLDFSNIAGISVTDLLYSMNSYASPLIPMFFFQKLRNFCQNEIKNE